MITARTITGGATYLAKHLRANDYYAEGEEVAGEWIGKGARALGLEGAVEAEQFERLRNNLHPDTGEKLTARNRPSAKVRDPRTGRMVERKQIVFHDITFSAPKAASVAAILGGDERIVAAWRQSVRLAVAEMERFAAVRLRSGNFANTEKIRITGNIAGALFFHDTSRTLDPQLHAHCVMANASFDKERAQWLALQRLAMMEASPYVRTFLYQDFGRRLLQLGYQLETSQGGHGFGIVGINKEAERLFSARACQRTDFETRYRQTFGHSPSKRRVEQFIKDIKGAAEARFRAEYGVTFGQPPTDSQVEAFVKDSRDPKLREISTEKVRQAQRERAGAEMASISETVERAR